jgi:diacylglycerol kinase (ATP)
VPVGSGNDYVKMLRIPRDDPRAAAAALLDGEPRAVDLGLLEGGAPHGLAGRPELFNNNLGIAFAGFANAKIETTRGLPGPFAYWVGSVVSMFTYRFDPYGLVCEGRTIDGNPTIIHVNIGKYCGAGMVFTPDADMEDGLFEVFYLAEMTRLRSAIVWSRVTSGRGKELPEVSYLKSKEVVVRGPKDFVVHADGEVRYFPQGVLKARLLPKALRVVHAPVAKS